MTEEGEDEWEDADEEAWCLTNRSTVLDYLSRQGFAHGRVGDLPAWHIAPYLSLWAVESFSRPDVVGWWVICGDLPTDYCSSDECRTPRLAIRRISASWQMALDKFRPGDETLGSTGIPASFADMLSQRAKLLSGYADDDGLWPDGINGSFHIR